MIGIFDSGIGGLSYAKELNKVLPTYDFIYLGDQLRVPYGGRSQEAIQKFTEECVNKLWNLGANLIIIACNTASAEALRYLQQKYPNKKILGILIPGVEKAIESKGNIGVIATKGTVATNAYKKEILKRNKEKQVFQVSAPLLVPFIEEKLGKSPECRKILKKYLRPLKNSNIKSLILGCTHYPHIIQVFKKIMGTKVSIIDSGKEAAIKLCDYLERHPEIEKLLPKNSKRQFFTTDCYKNFEEQGIIFYGERIKAKKIQLT